MARIRGRDTGPELQLRSRLWERGFRYRLGLRVGRTRPDILFTKQRLAVFVDGCFWHGCPQHYVRPRTRTQFWSAKLRENVQRDRRQTRALGCEGWKVLRIWEHEVFTNPTRVVGVIERVAGATEYRPRAFEWRVVEVTPRDAEGKSERRKLLTLREPTGTRTVLRRRTTKKW